MKNIVFLLILLIVPFFFSFNNEAKKFDAELIDIKYYSVNQCQATDNVYIMVTYKVDFEDIYSLKIKNEFANGVTTSSMVGEINKKNYIVYSFCSSKKEIKSFVTSFISPKGKLSNSVIVKINVNTANIITGTPPQTIKNNKK